MIIFSHLSNRNNWYLLENKRKNITRKLLQKIFEIFVLRDENSVSYIPLQNGIFERQIRAIIVRSVLYNKKVPVHFFIYQTWTKALKTRRDSKNVKRFGKTGKKNPGEICSTEY